VCFAENWIRRGLSQTTIRTFERSELQAVMIPPSQTVPALQGILRTITLPPGFLIFPEPDIFSV
jgi:hypothetical protein